MKRERANAAKPSKPLPTGRPGWTRHLLPLAILAGAVLLVYSNSLDAPLLLDNEAIILKDARVHSVSPVQLHRILVGQYWEDAPTGLYRPLTTLSYLFNYTVLGNGANPEGYHWINLALHIANVILVYALGLAIFEQIPIALFLAALWGLHPLQTESVTNVVGRADLVSAFGVLAALLCHRRAFRETGWRKAAWLAGLALAMTAGMFSKESAIVAIAVLVAFDFTFDRKSSWRARLPGYAATVLPCLVYLVCRAVVLANLPVLATQFGDNPLLGAGFWTARMSAVKVIGHYVLLWLWPASLSYDYSYNQIPLFRWNDWAAILALAGCLAAVFAAWRNRTRHKPLFFAVAFFFVTLSPVSNLLLRIGSIMAERFLYLPSLAFAILAVYGLLALREKRAQAAGVAALVILLAASARTWARNSDYADPQRFWRSAVEAAPGSYKTHLNAAAHPPPVSGADWDRSLEEMHRTLAILDGLPDTANVPMAYRNAGDLYRLMGERVASGSATGSNAAGTSADSWYRQSLAALLRSRRIELAWSARYRAENPKWSARGLTSIPSALYLSLGRTYRRLGDLPDAVESFEKGHQLGSDPDLLQEMAGAYRDSGQPHKAALALVEALAVDPNRTQINNELLNLYQQVDPQGCAVSRDGASLSLNVECPLVHNDICAASSNVEQNYLRRGKDYEAAAIRRIAATELGCRAGN